MGVKTFVLVQWDRVFAWVAVALGLLVLLIGWLGVSRSAFVFEQLPYVVSGGVGGLFLLGVGAMMWLSADLRDEWRKLDALEVALLATQQAELPDEPVAPPLGSAAPAPRGARRTSRSS
ncbi:MAG: hypothetical protein JWN08_1449 [Frankiales bacterium]|jgi:hypothetical protein|nr:hypothetical protein [Frankiales bacterium]